MRSIRGLNAAILSPQHMAGQIVSLPEENAVNIRYSKDKQDNFIDVEIDANFICGILQGNLSRVYFFFASLFSQHVDKDQLGFLVKFFDFSTKEEEGNASNPFSEQAEDYEDCDDPTDPLEILQVWGRSRKSSIDIQNSVAFSQ